MKKYIYISLASLVVSCQSLRLTYDQSDYEKIAETGDLIFQTEVGRSQAHAIQIATASPYNHVGVVVEENGKFYVYEAHGPVKKTKLDTYINRKGSGKRFVVYRHDHVTEKNHAKIKRYLKSQVGKPYDNYLSWDNSALYCSELAYKALGVANLTLEEPPKLSDMTVPIAIGKIIPNGYKLNNLDMENYVVAPGHLARDVNIYKIYQNW
jgi:hypothetical protein